MRSVKLGLGLVLVSALSVGWGVVGCSSDVSNDGTGEPDAAVDSSVADSGKTPGKDGSIVDTGSGGHDAGNDATTSGGHDDAGTTDAAIDADADAGSPIDAAADAPVDAQPDTGPFDAGAPGSPCAPLNTVQSQTCGMCGSQQRVCLAGADGGGPVWQDWGGCLNEVVNGCVPGTTDNEACGMCGHRTKICQLDCVFAVGSCQGQPPNACEPGTTNFVEGLSCDAGSGRSQTCDNTCSWGGYGACGTPDYGAPVAIATTVAGTVTSVRTMLASPTLPALKSGSCPATITTPGSKNAYAYVLVSNGTSQTAKVSIWFSKAAGGQDIDTLIAAYPGNGALPPLSDAARANCLNVGPTSNFYDVNDYCYSSKNIANECSYPWGGLVADDDSDNSVTIGPNGSVWIYAGATALVTSTTPHSGAFQINVRTESLN